MHQSRRAGRAVTRQETCTSCTTKSKRQPVPHAPLNTVFFVPCLLIRSTSQTLTFRDQTKALHLDPVTSPIEIYRSQDRSSLDLAGVVSHALIMQQSTAQLDSVDVAQAKLQASLNAEKQRREENRSVDSSPLYPVTDAYLSLA